MERSVSGVTFVTAWFNIYDDKVYNNKTEEWRFEHFELLLKTGIQICIFVSEDMYDKINEFCNKYENLKILRTMKLEDTRSYEICSTAEDISMPSVTHSIKDTFEYMALMDAKIEFVNWAIKDDPFNSTHFAWIDFSIAYLLKDKKEEGLSFLRFLSKQNIRTPLFAIPGCIGKLDDECGQEIRSLNALLDRPFWRFSGSFFLGDKESLVSFYNVFFENLPLFLNQYKKMLWEVNYWGWLEGTGKWSPEWYLGYHDETIFNIPSEYFVRCLDNVSEKIVYDYPDVYGGGPDNETYQFKSSSPSYIYYDGKHILNTRFVNYSYDSEGKYDINDYHNILHTKNIRSYLDKGTMLPYCYGEMYDNTIGLESFKSYSHGLEDMRLFEYKGELWFVCTNVNYNPDSKNRIMIGKYDHEKLEYSDCRVLQPPSNTRCEKNWIPIVKGDELYFIYSWSEMMIGRIIENNQLDIVDIYDINVPLFNRVRGSTTFIPYKNSEGNDTLLGIVHYSEDRNPRHYFHIFVELDPDNFKPLRYSNPFCFQHYGVEFCIGFTADNEKSEFIFWVSKKDNDATMIRIPIKEFSLSNHF